MPTDYVAKYNTARAALEARQSARRGTGPVSGRTERRDRARTQALALHPGLQPSGEVPETQPPLQYVTPDIAPGASWTAWMNAPSTGGVSGRPFVSMARWSPQKQVMEVIFENSGKRWEYPGVSEEDWREYRAANRSWPTLFAQRKFGPGQPSRQFEKL